MKRRLLIGLVALAAVTGVTLIEPASEAQARHRGRGCCGERHHGGCHARRHHRQRGCCGEVYQDCCRNSAHYDDGSMPPAVDGRVPPPEPTSNRGAELRRDDVRIDGSARADVDLSSARGAAADASVKASEPSESTTGERRLDADVSGKAATDLPPASAAKEADVQTR